jgi:hypothetical protein
VVMNGGNRDEFISASVVSVLEDDPKQDAENVDATSASGNLSQELAPESINETNGAGEIVGVAGVDDHEEEVVGGDILDAMTDEVDEEEGCFEGFSAIRIHDEDMNLKFLLCGVPCTLDACLLGTLKDGLNALLNIEICASKLQNRASAHPPLQAEDLSHGVATMRCEITTCSSAHVAYFVSGSAQTCFGDQLLGSRIKNEIIEKRQLVCVLLNNEDIKPSSFEPWPSMGVACEASTFEVWITMQKWAAQVLKHLAPEISYRSLVALGIAWINGIPVSSFGRQDADQFIFFCSNQCGDQAILNGSFAHVSNWAAPFTKDNFMLVLYEACTGQEVRLECKNVLLFEGRQNKGSFRHGISELTQWWLNGFSLGNGAMAVQSQPYTQQKFMNKLMGLQFRMVYDRGKENIATDVVVQDLWPRVTIYIPYGNVFSVQKDKTRRLPQFWVGRSSTFSTKLIRSFHDSMVWECSVSAAEAWWIGLQTMVEQFGEQWSVTEQEKEEQQYLFAIQDHPRLWKIGGCFPCTARYGYNNVVLVVLVLNGIVDLVGAAWIQLKAMCLRRNFHMLLLEGKQVLQQGEMS